jgi:FAD/FMN-containing dehydrogenase
VHVEPGARWLDVARTLQPHGLGISSGDYGGVGVGGLATAGGAGWLVREHGLTIDHVRAVEMVLADGSSVRADATTLPDLFWAVRGAGSNFGVVTAFEIAASPVSPVGYAEFVLVGRRCRPVARRLGGSAGVRTPAGDQLGDPRAHTPRPTGRGAGQHRRAQRTARRDPRAAGAFCRCRAADPAVRAGGALPARDRQRLPGAAPGGGRAARPGCRGPAHHRRPCAWLRRAAGQWEAYYFQIRALGGAVADVPADATAYAHRDANFLPGALGRSRDGMNREWDRLRPQFDGAYPSFESDDRPGRLAEAFPPATLARLRGLKRSYDPHNLFRDNFNIDPAGVEESKHTS